MRLQNQKWVSSVCYITLYVLDALGFGWQRNLFLVLVVAACCVVDTSLCSCFS